MYEQLTFFPETREEKLEREVQLLKKELSSVRKGIYARHGELQRKYDQTIYEFELLKAEIARTTKREVSCRSKSSNIIPLNPSKENTTELFTYCFLQKGSSYAALSQ